jgi:Icc-related predicted phosphoesterase
VSALPYWLALGDIHDDISRLEEIPELENAAGVIITGDITLAGGIKQARRVLEPIAKRVPLLLAQIGNMDQEEITGWLEKKEWNLHARARELFPDILILGVGGSPSTPFGTPSEFTEEQLKEYLERAYAEAKHILAGNPQLPGAKATTPRLILVSHTPPYSSACDRLRSGLLAGSAAVRAFIEKRQPDICICGHIHESRAQDRIGKTLVINPGTVQAGGYVLLRLRDSLNGQDLEAELKILP